MEVGGVQKIRLLLPRLLRRHRSLHRLNTIVFETSQALMVADLPTRTTTKRLV